MHARHCRQPQALTAAKERYSAAIDLFIAEQFIFDKQWTAVKVERFLSPVVQFVAYPAALQRMQNGSLQHRGCIKHIDEMCCKQARLQNE